MVGAEARIFFFDFMDDNNPNAVTAEIISFIYSTPLFSRDFIPPEVALFKFKHSNNKCTE